MLIPVRIICGCFCAVVTDLSACPRGQMAHEPYPVASGPFQKACNLRSAASGVSQHGLPLFSHGIVPGLQFLSAWIADLNGFCFVGLFHCMLIFPPLVEWSPLQVYYLLISKHVCSTDCVPELFQPLYWYQPL